jgi:hypothetical protein
MQIRQNPQAYQRYIAPQQLPAPIGGWNARDAFDMMPPQDALQLENFIPRESYCELRRGYESYATGLTDPVENILEYAAAGTREFYAFAGTSIFDISSAGAVGAADVTGLTNSRWNGINVGVAGGDYLWCWNETGNDAPYHYNGTAWAQPTLTGITAADVIYACLHQRRLFMVMKNSLSYAYLGVAAISGTPTVENLAPLFSKGGELIAIGTWTRDGGAGPDDLICFLTSQGQVAVYAGTDPATPSAWALQGVFDISEPIGTRPIAKIGGDLVIITSTGFEPLSRAMPAGGAVQNLSISDKISGAVTDAANRFRSNFGWEACLYPEGRMLLFNIPTSAVSADQYVMDVNTAAWCKFKDMNAFSWGLYNNHLYFGGDGVVWKADVGSEDDGAHIMGLGQSSYQALGNPGYIKRVTQVRPVFQSSPAIPLAIDLTMDYADAISPYESVTNPKNDGAVWDVELWGVPFWAGGADMTQGWYGLADIGYLASVKYRTLTNSENVRWFNSLIQFETGQGL